MFVVNRSETSMAGSISSVLLRAVLSLALFVAAPSVVFVASAAPAYANGKSAAQQTRNRGNANRQATNRQATNRQATNRQSGNRPNRNRANRNRNDENRAQGLSRNRGSHAARSAEPRTQDPRVGQSSASGPKSSRVGGVKSSHADTATPDTTQSKIDRSRRRSNRDDRRSRNDGESGVEPRLVLVRQAQDNVELARAAALDLYRLYDTLNTMSEAEIRARYPNGNHAVALRNAAINYNNSVVAYEQAKTALAQSRAALSGGQALSGSASDALDALLGR